MAEHKKYYINVPGALVEVSEGVYFAYYQEKRRGRTLKEKDERNGAVSYDGLDTPELTGQEMIPDRDAVSVEDAAIANILRGELRRCLALLDEPDRQLIQALYFENLSEREFALRNVVLPHLMGKNSDIYQSRQLFHSITFVKDDIMKSSKKYLQASGVVIAATM